MSWDIPQPVPPPYSSAGRGALVATPFLLEVFVPRWLVALDLLAWLALATRVCLANRSAMSLPLHTLLPGLVGVDGSSGRCPKRFLFIQSLHDFVFLHRWSSCVSGRWWRRLGRPAAAAPCSPSPMRRSMTRCTGSSRTFVGRTSGHSSEKTNRLLSEPPSPWT